MGPGIDHVHGPTALRLTGGQIRVKGLELQLPAMFAARPFLLNKAPAALAGVAVRAISIKTTTIKG